MKLYNTLSRKVEELVPLEQGKVKLYTCGLTVYSHPHIGNWSPYIYWDVLVRVLQHSGLQVERTQNITDVGHLTSDDDSGEDKMEKGAHREGVTAWDIAEKYIAVASEEAAELGLQQPTHLVRATSMIDEQIAFAKVLDEKGYLYEIDGDGMYFDTSKFPDYGRLARLDIDGLEAGARVTVAGKRNITDFAVWKFSPKGVKRDMEWESPWGIGFPGWHLECSTIARETLGDQIDIHCGGIDHVPVHHINEIAQTEAITGKQFSQFWVHNNHMKVDGQKMSKSLGNVYTLDDVKARGFTLEDYKLFVLQKHYRNEGNFTWENLHAAANRLQNWREAAALIWQETSTGEVYDKAKVAAAKHTFVSTLADDLNTPFALTIVDKVLGDYRASVRTKDSAKDMRKFLETVAELLGLNIIPQDITNEQKQLLKQRDAARQQKDWAESDRLRDQLKEQGIGLRDNQTGSYWFRLK